MQENPYKNSNCNDHTLNKQGQVPQYKVQNQKINPKELSNEELEYIIKTGQLPPKYMQTQQMPLQQDSRAQVGKERQSQFAQFNIQAPPMNKPQSQYQKSLAVSSAQQTTTNSIYECNKENQNLYLAQNVPLEIGDLMNSKQEIQYDCNPSLKHFSSPRMMTDFLQTNAQKQNPFAQQSLQQTHQQSVLETSMFKNNNDQSISPMNQSHQSMAASNALKALQDKIRSLEKDKAFLEDKISALESQANESHHKLSAKLKEETEKACTRENQLKEENFILKKQLETVEQEKMRHLEENSNERDQWRQMHKQVEEENINLKKNLNEEMERQQKINDTIQDIKKREAQLRERYEGEVQQQRERISNLQQDMQESKTQYERLKSRLQDKLKDQKKDYERLEIDFIQMRDSRDKENQKLKRENEILKNQLNLMKEEMTLFGNNTKKEKNHDLKMSKVKKEQGMSPSKCGTNEIPKQLKSNKKNKSQKVGKRYERKGTAIEQQPISKSKGKGDNLQSSQKLRLASAGSKYSSRVKSQASQRSPSKQDTGKKKITRKKQKRSESRQPVTLEPLSNKKTLMTGVNSESNLISINTKKGKAENLKKSNFSSSQQDRYIFIEEPKNKTIEQQLNIQEESKRPSRVDSSLSKEFLIDGGLVSQQSSVGDLSNSHFKKLDFGDFDTEKKSVENEIFYLEREIFDCNQQYKSLLSQQSLSQDLQQPSSQDTSVINQKLRQIAQQLEQKSEKLFDLKKKQQQMILKESFRGKTSLNHSTRSQQNLLRL